MAVMLPPTRLETLGNVTEATVFAEFNGTSAANTYMVIGCELPPVELRYGMVATVMLPFDGDWAQSVKNSVAVVDVPSV
jgi:hypothetical protein